MGKELNDRNFDRMIDGELDAHEQSRLLCACEEDPAQWRALALAYVEAQTWRSDFAEIRDEWQETKPDAMPGATPAARHKRPMSLGRLLNVAAMLLLSLTIGFGVGALSFTGPTNDRPSQLARQSSSAEHSSAEAAEEIMVLVQNQQTSELQPMKVPLVNISDINTGLDRHQPIPADIWRSLRDQGHDVSHQRQWYHVRLNDGRNGLVPIDSFRVLFDGFQ